jgi:hypothetical protein
LQHRATFVRGLLNTTVRTSLVWASLTTFAHAEEPETEAAGVVPQLKIEAIAPVNEALLRGIEALEAGKDRDAVSALEAAYAFDHAPAALLHLGAANAHLDRPQAAVKALEDYLLAADATRDAQSIEFAKQEIERLRSASGRIGLHMIPQHAKVTLDDEVVDPEHGDLLVAPGKHAIKASADGYVPFAQTLDVLPGKFTLEIELKHVDMSAQTVALAAPKSSAAQASAPMREATDEPEASAANGCVLSSVCIGPVASLIGPPNLIGGGVHARIGNYFGLGFDYQAMPKLNFNPISVQTSLISANARLYPFGGSFFLGGGIGYQSIKGDIREGDISINAQTGFPAAMASLGFMGHDGFVLGADLGLLFPLGGMRVTLRENAAALTQNGISQADIDQARDDAENSVNKALRALPMLVQVNLLRLGYMF